ncbi:hypothetical protein [Cetobacterium sp.]|uniref:hypothetical protein n=1 Tax=Cetobacterium sp. TaxID=2071632 RepID=UPI003F2B700E
MFFNIFKRKKRKIYMVFKKGKYTFNISEITKEAICGDPRLTDKILKFDSIQEAINYSYRFKGERNFQIIFKEI